MSQNNFDSGGGDGSGSGGSTSLSELSDTYTEGGEIRLFALLQALLGSFAALWFGVGIEVLSVFVEIQVWAIDGVGKFLESVLLSLFGTSAAVQTQAWATAAESVAREPMLVPFILAAEALALYAIIHAVRERGVLP